MAVLMLYLLTLLQYEGGINVTATVVRAIFALASRVGDKPDMTEVSLPSALLTEFF